MAYLRICGVRWISAAVLLLLMLVSVGIRGGGAQEGFSMRNSARALALGLDGRIYVGTFGNGVYRSPDAGAHWEKIMNGLDDPYILTLHPVSKDVIFAGTARKGVFRTRDGGDHWEKVNTGLGPTEVKALLYHGKTLYAGTGDGVFRSANHGDQWEPFNAGMRRILVRTLVVDAKGVLFAGTEGKGIFVFKPKAEGWEQSTRGFKSEPGPGILETFIRTLTIGPDGTLYGGTFDGGVYISTTGGERWTWWGKGMENESIRAVLVGPDGMLYAGTGKGVYARAPKDEFWKLISSELEDDSVQAMVIDSSGTLFVGTNYGLYKGDIKGKWTAVTPAYSQTGLPPSREKRPVETVADRR